MQISENPKTVFSYDEIFEGNLNPIHVNVIPDKTVPELHNNPAHVAEPAMTNSVNSLCDCKLNYGLVHNVAMSSYVNKDDGGIESAHHLTGGQ